MRYVYLGAHNSHIKLRLQQALCTRIKEAVWWRCLEGVVVEWKRGRAGKSSVVMKHRVLAKADGVSGQIVAEKWGT